MDGFGDPASRAERGFHSETPTPRERITPQTPHKREIPAEMLPELGANNGSLELVKSSKAVPPTVAEMLPECV